MAIGQKLRRMLFVGNGLNEEKGKEPPWHPSDGGLMDVVGQRMRRVIFDAERSTRRTTMVE